MIKDDIGRCLVLQLEIGDTSVVLCNINGEVIWKRGTHDTSDKSLGGDHNFSMDLTTNRFSPDHWQLYKSMICDIWRVLNAVNKQYTWYRYDSEPNFAHLDFFLIHKCYSS